MLFESRKWSGTTDSKMKNYKAKLLNEKCQVENESNAIGAHACNRNVKRNENANK